MDGPKHFYSDNKYNLGEGLGDIEEVRRRRKWRKVDYWQSDTNLRFGSPVQNDLGKWVRNEYLYVGRTTRGVLNILNISLGGKHRRLFRVAPNRATVRNNGYVRIKVSFSANVRNTVAGVDAYVIVRNDVNGVSRIKIFGES